MNVIKYCSSCQTEKPITDFGKRAASRDGLASKCKQCQREYDKSRANNPDRVAARAAYARTERGKEARRRAQAKYAESHREEATERCREYRRNNPKKSRAHDLVAYAMKTGVLTRKPCEVCGQKSDVAHHDDYDRPLEVRWLCAAHHRQWHVENGPGLNGT